MLPRQEGVGDRGREHGQSGDRGERCGSMSVQQEQENQYSVMAEAPSAMPQIVEEEEVQGRAPEILQPAVIDAGAILQQLATAMTTLAGGARLGPQARMQVGSMALEECRKVERELRPTLGSKMVLLELEEYENLVNQARIGERDLDETKNIYEDKRGKNARFQQEGGNRKRFKGSSSTSLVQPSYKGSTVPESVRRAEGTFQRPIVCYNCKQLGHKSIECPQKRRLGEPMVQRREGNCQRQIVCYNCRQPGHKGIECPQGKRKGESVTQVRSGQWVKDKACYGCGKVGHIQRFCPHIQKDTESM